MNQESNAAIQMSETEQRLWDLFIFARRTLGFEQFTKLHMGWFEMLLQNQFILLLAPRGHMKSSAITTAYTLWRLVQDRDMRILIVNETLSNARNFLRVIKEHITANERFIHRYGSWELAASKWTEDSVVIPRTKISKEPSISVGGVLGNLVSLHNDLIVLDDPVSDKNSFTPHQRQKLVKWFKNVILPALEPKGQLVLVGTRWHSQDMYGHILEDAGFKHWKRIVLSAEWKDAEGHRQILFPERFSPEKLDELRGTMGTASYYCQMLNDVAGQEGSDFKIEWLRSCRYTERPESMNIYIGVDLAAAAKESESKFAYVVVGVPEGGKDIYVLDAHKEHMQFPAQVKTIKRLCHIYKPCLACIEVTAYQHSLVQALRDDKEASTMPIQGVAAHGDKQRRLRSLAVRFENGAIRLPDNLPDLEEDLLHFPRGEDDLLDALFMAIEAVGEYRSKGRISYVEDLA
jgi:predicted phage terminase large subunit-like protein